MTHGIPKKNGLLKRGLTSFVAMLLVYCAACGTPLNFTLTLRSPEIASHQGYTTDGMYHYTSGNAALYKHNDDEQWSVAAENRDPFAGLSGHPNHLGDLDYFDGKLYVPVELNRLSCNFAGQQIAVYDADDLSLVTSVDVSAQGAEISGVAVVPDQNALYVESFCDGSKLWKYNLSTLVFQGTLSLSRRISRLQGITWDGSKFYASSSADNLVYIIQPEGTVLGPVLTRVGCEAEGVKWYGTTLRWLVTEPGAEENCISKVNSYVYFYHPLAPLDR